jgi:hypothetical protein
VVCDKINNFHSSQVLLNCVTSTLFRWCILATIYVPTAEFFSRHYVHSARYSPGSDEHFCPHMSWPVNLTLRNKLIRNEPLYVHIPFCLPSKRNVLEKGTLTSKVTPNNRDNNYWLSDYACQTHPRITDLSWRCISASTGLCCLTLYNVVAAVKLNVILPPHGSFFLGSSDFQNKT